MHPTEIIELIIVGGVLLIILFVAFLLKGKWRKIIRGLAVIYLVAFGIFYVVRPSWIDLQIENKIGYLDMYLEVKYPEETWEFKTVPHREDGYKHMNPYHIGVKFETEPEVEYRYFVSTKDDIIQVGYSGGNQLQSELSHLEEE